MNFSAQSGSGSGRWRKTVRRVGWLVGFPALCGVLASCQTTAEHVGLFQPDYRPDNVFAYPPKLSLKLQRVAVLPLAASVATGNLPEGCETLTPMLWEQLVKTKRFEVVAVDSAQLRRCTGRSAWAGTESLPPDFFVYLRREYGCDAVLFGELTTYRPYTPIAVGWRLKLVDAQTGQIIWAADELFDAAKPAVAKAAGHFEQKRSVLPILASENWVALNSPRRFGSYSAAAVLNTLPER